MKWIVGCDMRPGSAGALEWISWLAQLDAVGPGELSAFSIIEERSLFSFRDADAEIPSKVGSALRAQLGELGIEGLFGEVSAMTHVSIADALGAEARARDAAIAIGRLARRGEERLVRLGRTARNLLRLLPAPVVVVPPDLQASDIGSGPVVVAIDARDESLAAARFGVAMARAFARPVVLAHVLPPPVDACLDYLRPDQADDAREEHDARARRELSAFLDEHGLGDQTLRVLEGSTVDALLQCAASERAALLVCGSRQLGSLARVITASVGTELAAAATVPVAVVPPDVALSWI
jgi:nucleotide-binding universal stress UspA family protein